MVLTSDVSCDLRYRKSANSIARFRNALLCLITLLVPYGMEVAYLEFWHVWFELFQNPYPSFFEVRKQIESRLSHSGYYKEHASQVPSKISVAIIGGGVIGCSIAKELSSLCSDVFVFEKNPSITQGENQSTRNSGVIHSGIYYDQQTRPQKAVLCVEGNRLLHKFCASHKIPSLKTGKLIVATTEDEEEVLEEYLVRAKENGVPKVEMIPGKSVSKLEPNVAAESALLVPSAGIIDAPSLLYRLHTLAGNAGVHFVVNTEVIRLNMKRKVVNIVFRYSDGTIDEADAVLAINAGGIHADSLARQLNPDYPYELDPVRGESYKFYSHKLPRLRLLGKNIYPTPEVIETPHGEHFTVGVHLTPTFEDLSYPPRLGSTVTVGPKLSPVKDIESWRGDWIPAKIFSDQVRKYFPALTENDLIWHQAGVQARLKDHPDFVIERDPVCPHLINLIGIDSPGLTACLSIARKVAEIVAQDL
jgi:L-2-hydroxyglutarate oxidase LhgO